MAEYQTLDQALTAALKRCAVDAFVHSMRGNRLLNQCREDNLINELPLPWAEFNERASRWFRSPKPVKRYSAWDTYARPKGKYAA